MFHRSPPRARGGDFIGAGAESRQARTLGDAKQAFEEFTKASESGFTSTLLDECRFVAVFPGVVKGALGIGGRMGRGVIGCRDNVGTWSPPSFMTLAGGGFGFQIGIQKADILALHHERTWRTLVPRERGRARSAEPASAQMSSIARPTCRPSGTPCDPLTA